MELRACSEQQQHKVNSVTQRRKRKRNRKGVNDGLIATGINELPDDVLIAILSRLRFSSSSTLEFDNTDMFSSHDRDVFSSDDRDVFSFNTFKFDHKDMRTRIKFLRKKFIAYVDRVLKLHRCARVDGLVIRFGHLRSRSPFGRQPGYIDKWIYFALHKEVKTLELKFSPSYEFPDVDMLLSHSNDVLKFGFGPLRSLTLARVHVKDEVVHYFLASCPYLEQLCISGSGLTKNLQVVDPLPSLKVLEISNCHFISSLEVSATNLVSCTYQGYEVVLPFKKIPNLFNLTLGGEFAQSFIYEPNKHSSYSVQLEKHALNIPWEKFSRPGLRYPPDLPHLFSLKHLELDVCSPVGHDLHFFTSLIKASPLLNEFRIKISYTGILDDRWGAGCPEFFSESLLHRCCHKNLKAVKMSGYVGCSTDDRFVLRLLEIAPSLETLTIDTESEYYGKTSRDCCCKKCSSSIWGATERPTGARTRIEAKERAEKLKLSLSQEKKAVVTVM